MWQGRIGEAPLRVDMLPSGRIFASWSIRGNERRAVVDTIQQLEQRVLFQLMLGAGPGQDAAAREVVAAVLQGQQGLPDPTQAPPPGQEEEGWPSRPTSVAPPPLTAALPPRSEAA